jgi:hypothetical protein
MGYLEKKNPSGVGWKKRFWVLEEDKALLSWYYPGNEPFAGYSSSPFCLDFIFVLRFILF